MTPFGYRRTEDNLSLVEEPKEQAIIARVRELRAAGVGAREIAEHLDAAGFHAPVSATSMEIGYEAAAVWFILRTRAAVATFQAESEHRKEGLSMRELVLAEMVRSIAGGEVKVRSIRSLAREALSRWMEQAQ